MDLFTKKSIAAMMAEANNEGGKGLKRVLGPMGLIALGVGVVIGAGLFSVTGVVAGLHTGPAITISFALAAVACALAGLCYAEFASMIPISGSAYAYSYVTMGELVAWIIGWDLVLEYAVAAVTVSISWSRYFTLMLADVGWVLPPEICACPAEGGVVNLPAIGIVILLSLFLVGGTKGSARFNDFLVVLKLSVVFAFIFLGWKYVNTENLTPYVPANTGDFGDFGWSGVLRGAAIVFFAYIGFDAVSTAAQETINPKRNMPIGILGSLLVCTILYILFAHVMTGVVHYSEFAKSGNEIAPAAVAVAHMGLVGADGVVVPAYPWLNLGILIAILLGYSSVIMVMLMGQSRVFYSMSRDGLLPAFFSQISKRFHTPVRSNLLFMVLGGLLAGFVPSRVAGEMTSIGTLFAFALVCAGVIIVRRTMPDAPRGFRTPFVPLLPTLGVICCVGMMLFLPADTWLRLVIWMLIGLDIYSAYGVRHSVLGGGTHRRHGQSFLSVLGTILSLVCLLTAFWHQQTAGWQADRTLLYISCALAVGHILYYAIRFSWKKQ